MFLGHSAPTVGDSRTTRIAILGLQWYSQTMTTTIDKAGRVVIPAAIRERAGLAPGTEVDVLVDELGVRLVRRVPPPVLRRIRGRLVARPTAAKAKLPAIDPAAWIDAERDRWR
jgi:AbrB family looped-hinge helix DNA binding protein